MLSRPQLLVTGFILMQVMASAATGQIFTWEFNCGGDNFFSWQAQFSDSAGDPLATGEYTLEYCYSEDSAGTQLIGCCTTTVSIGPPAKVLGSGAIARSSRVASLLAYPVPIEEDVVKSKRGIFAFGFPELWLHLIFEGEPIEPPIRISSVPFVGVAQRVNGDIVTRPGKIIVSTPAPADSARIDLSADATGASIKLYNSAGDLKVSITSEDSTVTFDVPVVINSDLDVSGKATMQADLDVVGNIAVSGTVDGVNISSFKADYDNHQSQYTQFGNLNHSSVTVGTSWTKLITTAGTHSFTKGLDDTNIEVHVNSRFNIGTLTGALAVLFQIRVDGNIPDFHNQGAMRTSNTVEFLSLLAVFENLPAGSHTVSIWARAITSGSAAAVSLDPGGLGGTMLVKETR